MEYISINVKISVEIGDFSKGYQKRNRNKSHTPPPPFKKVHRSGLRNRGAKPSSHPPGPTRLASPPRIDDRLVESYCPRGGADMAR